jgi:hypothetical protein
MRRGATGSGAEVFLREPGDPLPEWVPEAKRALLEAAPGLDPRGAQVSRYGGRYLVQGSYSLKEAVKAAEALERAVTTEDFTDEAPPIPSVGRAEAQPKYRDDAKREHEPES